MAEKKPPLERREGSPGRGPAVQTPAGFHCGPSHDGFRVFRRRRGWRKGVHSKNDEGQHEHCIGLEFLQPLRRWWSMMQPLVMSPCLGRRTLHREGALQPIPLAAASSDTIFPSLPRPGRLELCLFPRPPGLETQYTAWLVWLEERHSWASLAEEIGFLPFDGTITVLIKALHGWKRG